MINIKYSTNILLLDGQLKVKYNICGDHGEGGLGYEYFLEPHI